MFPENVSEKVVKGIAVQVSALTIASLFIKPLIGIVAIDFAIRAFVNPKYSPLGFISNFISERLKIGKLIKFEPKRFAAMIGFAIALFASIFVGISLPVFYILAGTLILFSLLEGILGFCVGCKFYWLMKKFIK